MKNITTIITLLVSAVVLAGCGGNNNQSSATQVSGAALPNPSIADGLIRPEVSAALKELIIKGRDAENNLVLFKEAFTWVQALKGTSANQQERDLLHLYENTFNKVLIAYEIKDHSKRQEAIKEAFVSTFPERRTFLQKYIQSSQLRDIVLTLQDLGLEEMDLLKHPEKQSERKAHEEKAKSLAQQLIALYDNPNLDAQTKAEFAALEEIRLLSKEDIEFFRRLVSSSPSALSAAIPSLSEKISLRRARTGGAVDFSQLMVNGAAGSMAHISLPMYVQLKGSVEGSKDTKDLTGVAVYKFDNMLVGVIHGYANASSNSYSTLNHNETSAVVSRSFGKAYIEGQAGFVSSILNHNAVKGERYQVSFGYDFDAVTPFIQATSRNLNNVNEHAAYVGCELDVMNVVTDSYTLSGRLTVKGGYHSFKGTIGSVEGSGVIQLNNGLKLDAALNLAGGGESTARIGFSIDQ